MGNLLREAEEVPEGCFIPYATLKLFDLTAINKFEAVERFANNHGGEARFGELELLRRSNSDRHREARCARDGNAELETLI